MAEREMVRPGAIDKRSGTIRVEVVYALPVRAVVIALELDTGATVREAVEVSGIRQRYPEIVLAPDCLGVFGKAIGPGAVLHDGDRVEIYRPLVADPKIVRSARARSRKRR